MEYKDTEEVQIIASISHWSFWVLFHHNQGETSLNWKEEKKIHGLGFKPIYLGMQHLMHISVHSSFIFTVAIPFYG